MLLMHWADNDVNHVNVA